MALRVFIKCYSSQVNCEPCYSSKLTVMDSLIVEISKDLRKLCEFNIRVTSYLHFSSEFKEIKYFSNIVLK